MELGEKIIPAIPDCFEPEISIPETDTKPERKENKCNAPILILFL